MLLSVLDKVKDAGTGIHPCVLGLSQGWQEEVSTSEDDSALRCIAELEGLAGIKWLITGDTSITSAKVTQEVVAKKGAICWW
jgi:hypothetical protein